MDFRLETLSCLCGNLCLSFFAYLLEMALLPPAGFTPEHGLIDDPQLPYEPPAEDRAPGTPRAAPSIFAPPAAPPFKTVAVAMADHDLPPALMCSLFTVLGCGENDDATALGALPEEEIPNIVKELTLGDDMRAPTFFEKGLVYSFFKKLRSALAPPAAVAKAAPPAPIAVMLPDTSDRLEYRDWLDQTARGTFTMLSQEELRRLHERYQLSTGAPTTGANRPSDQQLSALSHRIRPQADGTMNPPFTEFAVFGAYDIRTIKSRQFHAHVLTREGTWQRHLLTGPSNYFAWEASWNVFEACMIMLDAAMLGQLRLYQQGIRQLADRFPKDWGTIAKIDETMRAERWGRLHQEIMQGSVATPFGFDAKKPWGTIIAETRFGYLQGPLADWWRAEEVKLERGQAGRPGGLPVVGPPLPPLPSHASLAELQDKPRWGTQAQNTATRTKPTKSQKKAWKSAAAAAAAPSTPKAPYLRPNKGNGKGGKKQLPENYAGCWHCGSKKHLLSDCSQWIAAGRPQVDKKKKTTK